MDFSHNSLFIELLQVSVGTRDMLSRVPSESEWETILEEAQRQAVVGIMASGVERLPAEQCPPRSNLLQWFGMMLQLEVRNGVTTRACVELCEQLQRDGFSVCVLKGQANLRYYPKEMSIHRTCGDIDIWTTPSVAGKTVGNGVRQVIEYVRSNHKMTGLCWLHCNFRYKDDVPVEVHFHPSFFSEPRKNWRFQKHFSDIEKCSSMENVDGVELPVMCIDEDVIYQMNHIYRHLIDEGIGLKQIVDYFMLLRSWNRRHNRTKDDTMRIVSHLGMKRFAGALMYVLQNVLGMSSEELLCPASEVDGRFLMSEIMISGNFGKNDPRMEVIPPGGSYLRRRCKQAWRRFKRNVRFFTSYPGEVFWEPIVRAGHYVWKVLKLWKLN